MMWLHPTHFLAAGLSGISMNYVSGINQQVAASDIIVSAAFFYIMEWQQSHWYDRTPTSWGIWNGTRLINNIAEGTGENVDLGQQFSTWNLRTLHVWGLLISQASRWQADFKWL